MENQAEALQQLAINVTLDRDNTQQLLLSKGELNAGMDFLRAAGRERRKRAIEEMNGKLVELAEKIRSTRKLLLCCSVISLQRRQKRERTNCGPWIGLLTAPTFRDPRIFKAAALTVSTEGAA